METNSLTSSLAARLQRRHELARMPMEQKLRAVVKLQEMAAPILKKRGKERRVWAF